MICVGAVVRRVDGDRVESLLAKVVLVAGIAAAFGGCRATDRLFCSGGGCEWTKEEWARLQTLSPLPPPPLDSSNRYWNNDDAAALGQRFYFDTRFSGNATLVDQLGNPVPYARAAKDQPIGVACATCHDPKRAGADFTSTPNTVSVGAGWYDVNSQQTVNASYYPLLYWNGRSDSLWSQAAAVAESGVSVNGTRLAIFAALVNDPSYRKAYNDLFVPDDPTAELPEPPLSTTRFPPQGKPTSDGKFAVVPDEADRRLVTRTFVNWAKAIAAYEYRLVSRDAPFDRFIAAGPDSDWISPAAKRGARLFVGKGSCIDCHYTPLFSDGEFHDIGVPQTGEHVPTVADCRPATAKCDCTPGAEKSSCFPSGAWAGLTKLAASVEKSAEDCATRDLNFNNFRRDSCWSDGAPDTDPDPAREAIFEKAYAGPGDASNKGAWRTPSLRDVAVTAPYMHDGVYATLDEVVWHYNAGAGGNATSDFVLPVCGSADSDGGEADGGEHAACMDAGAPSPGRAVQIKPLGLTTEEAADLVEFLKSLTGAPLPPALVKMPPAPSDGGVAADASAKDGPTGDGNVGSDGAAGEEAGINP